VVSGSPSTYPIEVHWEGGRRYRGGQAGGPTLLLDGERLESPGPVDALLISMAACAAIDVVAILEKRRTPATALSISVEFSRADSPPRRLTQVRFRFRVQTDSDAEQVDRAVALSIEKYCSVASSLDPEMPVSWEVEVTRPDGALAEP